MTGLRVAVQEKHRIALAAKLHALNEKLDKLIDEINTLFPLASGVTTFVGGGTGPFIASAVACLSMSSSFFWMASRSVFSISSSCRLIIAALAIDFAEKKIGGSIAKIAIRTKDPGAGRVRQIFDSY